VLRTHNLTHEADRGSISMARAMRRSVRFGSKNQCASDRRSPSESNGRHPGGATKRGHDKCRCTREGGLPFLGELPLLIPTWAHFRSALI